MKPEEQLTQLSNDIEGYLNDYSGGITNKEDTISGLVDYVLERVGIANNFRLKKTIAELNKTIKYHKKRQKSQKYHDLEDATCIWGLKEAIKTIKSEITKT